MGGDVTVLLFGPLRERAGAAEVRGHGDTVRDVWERLARERGLSAQGIRAARNERYCDWDECVGDGDVVAFLPPVAGGAASGVHAELTRSPIDVGAVIGCVGEDGDGAVAVFIGRVRDHSDGHAVSSIDYEAYDGMAKRALAAIAERIHGRGGISAIAVVHRAGTLTAGDPSVVVAVAAPHRAEALAACRDTIDMIKQTVPIWKREHRDDGARWVDARHEARAEVTT